ncbi:hypothetical protein [Algoriphagus terrigena]|uniref:hypothetical protein n=1 Tax=Algoriphagus terrigena TaxID=344884 RepID=UPI0004283DAE|nr:hypothetical protein [Algoriphagus terrigena]
MKNGINQSERLLPSLDPSYVVPDERTVLDLVQFTLDYSDAVSYFSFQNKRLDTWRPFLLNDPVFIVGMIAATSLDGYKLRQDDLLAKAENRRNTKKEIQEAMATNLLAMSKNLLVWEELFKDCNYSGLMAKEIINSKRFLETMIGHAFPFQSRYRASDFAGIPMSAKMDSREVNFTEYFKAAYKNLAFIVELAGRRFEDLINENTGNHQPHIGLLLAALKLFKEVQADMNAMTRRHLDFYYQRVLQQVSPPASPLQLLIGVVPKPGALLLPENSSFSLLFPTKKTIAFQNQFQTELSQARIVELRTLYKSNYFPFSSGFKSEKIALNGVYDAILYQGEGKNEVSFRGDSQHDFPIVMGEDQSQKGLNQRTMSASLLGLLVSSPVFLVENGRSFFQLTFTLSPASCEEFRTVLSELLHEKEAAMGVVHDHSDHELKSFIQAFLNEAFTVALTTAKGWKTLDFLHVRYLDGECKLVIKLEPEGLEEFPTSYDAALHGGVSGTTWPCVRFLLNNSAHYPPYRPLEALEILEVEISTLTKGVTSGFDCSNQLGKLDPSSPFLPFGSLPTRDSCLRVYDPLIFNKYLSRLSVKLTWMGLPEERTGFIGYYQAYPEAVDNQSFRGIVSLKSSISDDEEGFQAPKQKVFLFETVEKSDGEHLLKNKQIDLNLDLIDRTILKEPVVKTPGQDNPVSFGIQLTDPSLFAFGHESYPRVFSDISFQNSRHPRRQKELPRPPYTPQLEKLEFTYSNHTKENLSRRGEENRGSVKIFHLYPFGHSQVFPAAGAGSSYLIPQLSGKGNLLIGLTGLAENQLLNLGFKLHPAFFIHTITQPPKVTWEYLEKNSWVPLGNLLMEDSTHGMLQSGIVKLKLPSRLDFNNTRLAPGKFWLRVSNSGNSDINSRLIDMFTNSAWITQVEEKDPPEFRPVELRENLTVISNGNMHLSPAVGLYHIKIETFKRSPEQDRARVSELVRHRNRGITTWDLERLVLQRFPQIGRAMVYGRTDFPLHLVKNSNIQVVVIPLSPLNSQMKLEGFRAPFELLQEIRSYLQGFISPFSRLEVCNPVFEKLKIRGAVKFRQIQQSGYYRDMLERELIEFLSPNPKDFHEEKGFINSIYKAEIQNFIESRPYVEFVTGLSVLQIVDVQGSYKIIDTAETTYRVELLRTISPYAVLTSSESHQLEIIQDHTLLDPEIASIGDLSIDSDFIIKPKQ